MTGKHAHPIRVSWILLLVALMILLGSAARADVWPFGTFPSRTPLLSSAAAASLAASPQSGAETRLLRLGLARERTQGRTAARERRAWSRPKLHLAALGAPPVVPSTTSGATPVVVRSSADWYAIADCESDGVWQINSGNGYWGGLQFTQAPGSPTVAARSTGRGRFPIRQPSRSRWPDGCWRPRAPAHGPTAFAGPESPLEGAGARRRPPTRLSPETPPETGRRSTSGWG